MAITIGRFHKILESFPIKEKVIEQIKKEYDSPLNYAWDTLKDAMPENDIYHSYGVLINCKKIISKPHLKVTPIGYLLMFYASLLHDITKSKNEILISEINDALKEKCELFSYNQSDHGIRSAHYIDKKHDAKIKAERIKLYGLKKSDIRKLFNILSFHSSGRIHPCFLSETLQHEELLLCLIFRLADIADGADYRVKALKRVSKNFKKSKIKAREEVMKVSIQKNVIIWQANKQNPELEQAVNMANSELSKHRLLLLAFGLPDRIICLQKKKRTLKRDLYISHDDIVTANLCIDVSKERTPLVLSANTLQELYERIVEASYKVGVPETLSFKNYFGPVILEVKDVENDEAKKISIRSKTGKNFSLIQDYTETRLNPNIGSEKDFYFGYTHGQRIWRYLYPNSRKDLNKSLADKSKFKEWQGEINQFDHIFEILKKGPEARRAYVIIPHLIIDNPKSQFGIPEEEMAPALIAIQFMIEKDHELSGFALLRAQELSTFFVVNYLEVRSLIKALIRKLRHKFPDIKAGRIVMLSAFGYFHPNTSLLDKPKICQLEETDYQRYACELNDRGIRKEFTNLLKEFKKDYIKIETEWCEKIKKYLNDARYGEKQKIIKALGELKRDLDKLEKERKKEGHSMTSEIRLRKGVTINKFVEILEKGFE